MVQLYTSNNLSTLLNIFIKKNRQNENDIFDSNIVVIQSQSMKQWLSLEIARKFGVCINFNFLFPHNFFTYIANCFSKKDEFSFPHSIDIMTWQIMKLLPDFISFSEFEKVKHYITKNPTLKSYQFANEIASLFDRYLIFRDDMFLKQKNKKQDFQSVLWKKIIEENKFSYNAVLDNIKKENLIKKLPSKVYIFGISYLPTLYLSFFDAVSKLTEINFFLLKPSREYWGDFTSKSEKKRIMKKQAGDKTYIKDNNTLLECFGIQGRDFYDNILNFDWNEDDSNFIQNESKTLLSKIRNDFLNLQKREKKKVLNEDDSSIQIHSMHSKKREVEVLQDYLFNFISEDENLKPSDILITAPDIESYIPYINLVFSTNLFLDSTIPEAFSLILSIVNTRFEAGKVLEILEKDVISKKFLLDEDELTTIEFWIKSLNINWGVNEKSKKEINLPETYENTWQYGIDRLMLSYFMQSKENEVFCDILPFNNFDGTYRNTLGKFVDFLSKLFELNKSIKSPKNLNEWGLFFNKVLDDFIFEPETNGDTKPIRDIVNNLKTDFNISEFKEELDFAIVKTHIEKEINNLNSNKSFTKDGFTFSSMLAFRSIPFKIICVLGMDSNFPGSDGKMSFNLMAENFQKGDKSKTNDDAYLFLETLLSAQDKLYISYVGQDIKDNSKKNPSIFITELIDYIETNFINTEHLLTNHKLQGFSHHYFNGKTKNLFSYSKENLEIAKSFFQENKSQKNSIEVKTISEQKEVDSITLNSLCSFFKHPVKYFMNKNLDIYLKEKIEKELDAKENFKIENGIEKNEIFNFALNHIKKNKTFEEFYNIKKKEGVLPHNKLGEMDALKLFNTAQKVIKKAKEHIDDIKQDKEIEVLISIDNLKIEGTIKNIFENKLLIFKDTIYTKDKIEAWIYNLILSLEMKDIKKTIMVSSDNMFLFPKLEREEAENILNVLVQKYREGLKNPIHFFPETSYQYVKANDKDKKFQELKSNWFKENRYDQYNENQDIYNQTYFKEKNPIDKNFIKNSDEILFPFHQKISSI